MKIEWGATRKAEFWAWFTFALIGLLDLQYKIVVAHPIAAPLGLGLFFVSMRRMRKVIDGVGAACR